MENTTKRVVWDMPEDLHRLIKSEAARLGVKMSDYAIKVFTETLKAK